MGTKPGEGAKLNWKSRTKVNRVKQGVLCVHCRFGKNSEGKASEVANRHWKKPWGGKKRLAPQGGRPYAGKVKALCLRSDGRRGKKRARKRGRPQEDGAGAKLDSFNLKGQKPPGTSGGSRSKRFSHTTIYCGIRGNGQF